MTTEKNKRGRPVRYGRGVYVRLAPGEEQAARTLSAVRGEELSETLRSLIRAGLDVARQRGQLTALDVLRRRGIAVAAG